MLRLFLIIFCLGSASGQTCKDCITAAFSATGACASVPCTSSYCQICQTNATDTARANAIPPTCFWDTQGCALKTCGEQNCSAVCGAAKRCLLTNPIPETVPATLFFQWMLQQNSTNTAFGTVDRTGVNGANFNTDPTYWFLFTNQMNSFNRTATATGPRRMVFFIGYSAYSTDPCVSASSTWPVAFPSAQSFYLTRTQYTQYYFLYGVDGVSGWSAIPAPTTTFYSTIVNGVETILDLNLNPALTSVFSTTASASLGTLIGESCAWGTQLSYQNGGNFYQTNVVNAGTSFVLKRWRTTIPGNATDVIPGSITTYTVVIPAPTTRPALSSSLVFSATLLVLCVLSFL